MLPGKSGAPFPQEPAAQLGLFPMPLGDGDVRNDAPVSTEDIAAVSAAALADPERHAGKTYRPTGPALVSPNEIAATLGKVLLPRAVYSSAGRLR